mmetsp:Transcript_120557/g.212698  ORF Transcript_120557/g.212698 Transcript_120557/m.212698 type:complete len:251 (-) Transcript_120557:110-862(-)
MFALRKINNNYEDFAGTRSDFVVVGHPEFNLGRVGMDAGYKSCWDTRTRVHKPRSLPGDRLRREGVAKHISRLTEVHSPDVKRPTLKERALARSSSDGRLTRGAQSSPSKPPGGLSIADGGSFDSVDHFLADLESAVSVPSMGPQLSAAGFANHIRSQPIAKHYSSVQDELSEVRARSRLEPEMTREELLQDEAWRYYASHLEQARRREAKERRQVIRKQQGVKSMMMAPSGAVINPHTSGNSNTIAVGH